MVIFHSYVSLPEGMVDPNGNFLMELTDDQPWAKKHNGTHLFVGGKNMAGAPSACSHSCKAAPVIIPIHYKLVVFFTGSVS